MRASAVKIKISALSARGGLIIALIKLLCNVRPDPLMLNRSKEDPIDELVVSRSLYGYQPLAARASFILDEGLVQILSVGNPCQFGNCLHDAASTSAPRLLYSSKSSLIK